MKWILCLTALEAIMMISASSIEVIPARYVHPISQDEMQMSINVNRVEQTVTYSTGDSESFVQSSTFEDYKTRFAATKADLSPENEEEPSCYIRGIPSDLQMEEQITQLQNTLRKNHGVMPFEGEESVDVIEIDDIDEDENISEVGVRIKDFCKGATVYKMIASPDRALAPQERQTTIQFRRCFFCFFFFRCVTTTITIPTGTTLVILFGFFG